MIEAAARAMRRRLRVFIRADAARHADLRRIVIDGGHDVVDSPGNSDVVLSDGAYSAATLTPVVTLGSADAEQAGSLPSNAEANQIDAALYAVATGLVVRAPSSTTRGFAPMEESRAALLTPREIEVLDAIGEGLPNKSIAKRLDISPHTVKFHIEALFRKLGVRTRTEAAAKAWLRRSEAIDL